jgi:hypothetical protein
VFFDTVETQRRAYKKRGRCNRNFSTSAVLQDLQSSPFFVIANVAPFCLFHVSISLFICSAEGFCVNLNDPVLGTFLSCEVFWVKVMPVLMYVTKRFEITRILLLA